MVKKKSVTLPTPNKTFKEEFKELQEGVYREYEQVNDDDYAPPPVNDDNSNGGGLSDSGPVQINSDPINNGTFEGGVDLGTPLNVVDNTKVADSVLSESSGVIGGVETESMSNFFAPQVSYSGVADSK